MHQITPELHQTHVENILNKKKEFEYDFQTLKILQMLEERQHKEKTQFTGQLPLPKGRGLCR